jgi:hypothetical protein
MARTGHGERVFERDVKRAAEELAARRRRGREAILTVVATSLAPLVAGVCRSVALGLVVGAGA